MSLERAALIRYADQLGEIPIDCGPGWAALIEEMLEAVRSAQMKGEVPPDFKWRQIKQKLGGLRMYWPPTAELRALYETIVSRSLETCEICGRQGVLWTDGALRTRCEEHRMVQL